MKKVQQGIIKSFKDSNENNPNFKSLVLENQPLAFLSPIKHGPYQRHTNKRVTAATENEKLNNKTYNQKATDENKEIDENFDFFIQNIEVKRMDHKIRGDFKEDYCSQLKGSCNFSDVKSINVRDSFISRESQVKNIINPIKVTTKLETPNKIIHGNLNNSNSESVYINASSYNSDSTAKSKKKSCCLPFFCF